jgi:hypothetical protein
MSAITAALVGAVATAVLGALLSYINYRRTRKRLLDAAALRCLDRLRKLEQVAGTPLPANDAAIEALPEKQRDTVKNELWLLGSDGDRYLDCIAAVWPYERSRHLPLYDQLRPIILVHDLTSIPKLTPKLEQVALELSWVTRGWGRIVDEVRRVVFRPGTAKRLRS